ncbi:hypothetical protein FRB96_001891 [Tulasnella sp. 330]|nr:hypothetical protein FRB96_001891 [Tulasnella sp. 330]
MDHDWSSAIGNPVKLGLSIQAIFFPSVYAVQHFVLYRGREPDQDDDSRDREGHAMEEIVQPLLAEEDT